MIYATLKLASIILPSFLHFMLETVLVFGFRGSEFVAHVVLGLPHIPAQSQEWQLIWLCTMQTVMGTNCA